MKEIKGFGAYGDEWKTIPVEEPDEPTIDRKARIKEKLPEVMREVSMKLVAIKVAVEDLLDDLLLPLTTAAMITIIVSGIKILRKKN